MNLCRRTGSVSERAFQEAMQQVCAAGMSRFHHSQASDFVESVMSKMFGAFSFSVTDLEDSLDGTAEARNSLGNHRR